MKKRINLEKAADAEVFGALAVGSSRKHNGMRIAGRRFTPAQNRVLRNMVQSLVQVAREAGAEQKRITLGKVSFELREDGAEGNPFDQEQVPAEIRSQIRSAQL